jgi:hypothetical protein
MRRFMAFQAKEEEPISFDPKNCRHDGSVLRMREMRKKIDSSRLANDGLQLRRAITIQAEGMRLLEKHAIAPSAARLCYMALPWVDAFFAKSRNSSTTEREPNIARIPAPNVGMKAIVLPKTDGDRLTNTKPTPPE